eukprot:2235680-Pyramimonas_sp.AAC.1
MDLVIGERDGDDLRRSGRKALYEASREQKESLTQFAARREAQFLEAEAHDLTLSSKVKGFLLEEGSGLTAPCPG